MSPHQCVLARLALTRRDLTQVLDHLTDDDLRWAPRDGMKTVADLLLEIARKDMEIVGWVRDGAWPDDEPDPFDVATCDLAVARAGLESTRKSTLDYLASLSEGQLIEVLALPERWWESLGLLECPRDEMLRSIAMHEWYHTGQLVTYLWSRGHEPENWD